MFAAVNIENDHPIIMIVKAVRSMVQRRIRVVWWCGVLSILVSGWCEVSVGGAPLYGGALEVEVICSGLQQPADIAVHPQSGDVYVAEKGAGRISVIRNDKPVPVISSGGNWTVADELPQWALTSEKPKSYWQCTSLREPGGIAFATNGGLFVLEGVPDGRLFEFSADAAGNYTLARVIPIAWLAKPFTWTQVKSAGDGMLFICGNVEDANQRFFGSVLMRDPSGDWWVVDYGPFVKFAGIDLSQKRAVLLVGEQMRGGMAWWDVTYHVALGEMEDTLALGRASTCCALLPDGAFAVVERSEDGGNMRLLRVDPFSGHKEVLLSGVTDIGGVESGGEADVVYVTDQGGGKLLTCRIPQRLISSRYLIEQVRDAREIREGLTPREAPDFLRDFILKSGVYTQQHQKEAGTSDGGGAAGSFSIREFARNVPLIAGRLEVTPAEGAKITDPVEFVEFVVFFPGDVIVKGEDATPSMCYFSSQRRSGKVERTRTLFTGVAFSRFGNNPAENWAKESDAANFSIPVGTVNMKRKPEGRTVDVVFLGLGLMSDYYISLVTGSENRGTMMVESREGAEEHYAADFMKTDDSGQMTRNLIVAGFDPGEEQNEENVIGWLNIGSSPIGSALKTE